MDPKKEPGAKHVIKQLKFGTDTWTKANGTQKIVDYIVLEYAEGGELFDFVADTGRLDENMTRYYFKQLLDGLEFIHNRGFCHRDLKPENLLLDAHGNLKIADFGYAAPAKGKDSQGNLRTQCGTVSYMAPEILYGQKYKGTQVDVFCAGSMLFIMFAASPAFLHACP